jgi:hypothetical protein
MNKMAPTAKWLPGTKYTKNRTGEGTKWRLKQDMYLGVTVMLWHLMACSQTLCQHLF